MEGNADTSTGTESTEVVASTEKVGLSLRESLKENFSASEETNTVERSGVTEAPKEAPEPKAEATTAQVQQAAQGVQSPVPVAPPADMNKTEQEAFLNPTAENRHILQQYLSRRAYETRSEFKNKTMELENERKAIQSFREALAPYESEYARQGISLADVAKRSIEWDKAMQQAPIETALQWLESYGLTLEDLGQAAQGGVAPAQEKQYLTAAEAERIAQEKIEAFQEQARQNFLAEQNYNAVTSFMNSKPLFKDPGTAQQLEDAMAPIVAALSNSGQSPQEILETAYNYVTKGHPTFSALTQKLEAPVVVEQKTREVQKAKAATKSITGHAGSGSPRVKIDDLRDNLRRRMNGTD